MTVKKPTKAQATDQAVAAAKRGRLKEAVSLAVKHKLDTNELAKVNPDFPDAFANRGAANGR